MKINLFAEYASRKYQWVAQFSHTEGEIDVRNRLVYLVAEVDAPYEKEQPYVDRPPLTPGMFVKAELTGLKKTTIKLPRSVLRYDGVVWLVDERDKLQKKEVEILAKDRDFIYIKTGINQGDRIITNLIDFPLVNMQLSPRLIAPLSQIKIKELDE